MLILQQSSISRARFWDKTDSVCMGGLAQSMAGALRKPVWSLQCPPSLAKHCTTREFPKAFQPPPPLRTKRRRFRRKTKTCGWDSPWGVEVYCSVTFGRNFGGLFPRSGSAPVAAPHLCSQAAGVTANPKRHSSLLTKSCSRVTMCPQTVRPERPGCRTGKQWSGEKGNLLARWPCVFNWLLGKAEKVMCTNQSRITDQSQSELTRPRPIRNRVLLPSSAPPGLDRGSGQRALFTKTKWTTGLVADGGQDDNVPHPEVQPGEAPHRLQTPSAARSWPC